MPTYLRDIQVTAEDIAADYEDGALKLEQWREVKSREGDNARLLAFLDRQSSHTRSRVREWINRGSIPTAVKTLQELTDFALLEGQVPDTEPLTFRSPAFELLTILATVSGWAGSSYRQISGTPCCVLNQRSDAMLTPNGEKFIRHVLHAISHRDWLANVAPNKRKNREGMLVGSISRLIEKMGASCGTRRIRQRPFPAYIEAASNTLQQMQTPDPLSDEEVAAWNVLYDFIATFIVIRGHWSPPGGETIGHLWMTDSMPKALEQKRVVRTVLDLTGFAECDGDVLGPTQMLDTGAGERRFLNRVRFLGLKVEFEDIILGSMMSRFDRCLAKINEQ